MNIVVGADLKGRVPQREGTHKEARRSECSGCDSVAFFSCGEVNCRKPECDGGNQARSCNMIAPPGNWPLNSKACGVTPNKIASTEKAFREAGVNTKYTKKGAAIFTGPAHRRAHMKALNFHDRDSFM